MTTTASGFEEGLGATTLVELLRGRAARQGADTAYTFLRDGETDEDRVTFAELDRRARAIAATLQDRGLAGERALLLYPPGIDYIAGFFGCLYAGVVAVPAYPPDPSRLARTLPRILAIVEDAKVTAALTTGAIAGMGGALAAQYPPLGALPFIGTDGLDPTGADAWSDPGSSGETAALLQYTSGSVGTPKGVIITHDNVMANEAMIAAAGTTYEQTVFVAWLPPYHDMGLFGALLHPTYLGIPCTLMSPEAFLRRPYRWLQAISRYRGTISVAPDFAFDLCVRKVNEEERAALDLSSWSIAFNGSEPIRPATVERFTGAFAPCGFRRSVIYPCYGLAEATLIASGGDREAEPVVAWFDGADLERNRAVPVDPAAPGGRALVGCGRAIGDERILIVDPDTRQPSAPGVIGEIWLSGPNIGGGYWNRPDDTAADFGATLASGDGGRFLRTGDLGFFHGGELFVTGRLKDLIIIRGRNHYPQDIERTAQEVHPALRPGCGAAFAVDVDEREALVVVQEVDERRVPEPEALLGRIQRAVASEHDVVLHEIVLIARGSASKTTSGKIQRRACRRAYLDDELSVVASWSAARPEAGAASAAERPERLTPAILEAWLTAELSRQIGIPAEEIDVKQPLYAYGLDSLVALEMTQELETWLGRPVPPSLPYDYPTIDSIARALCAGEDEQAPARPEVITAAAPDGEPAPGSANYGPDPIAIVGMACRFPGAPTLAEFWALLRSGVDAITEVPPERWDAEAIMDPDRGTPGKSYTRWGGFIDGIDQFDPGFFGISPREAARIDPQQRLFLEVAWHALEDAGISPHRLAGTETGVFAGVYNNDYLGLYGGDLELIDAHYGTGNAHCIVANRLSYLLDLQGPSVAVDTACSSSLVALHLAAQGLRAGDCDVALAGGVNAILSPENHIYFSQARAMAADGRCKTFDSRADGFVRGEGGGVVVLKKLSRALADGDRIYAVVRGSAINQDGRTNGLTAPNGVSQVRVLRKAMSNAAVSAADLGYVEAHGTGTPIGDQMELQSMSAVLRDHGAAEAVWIGSVKTNIGHLESAAGIAGVIKTALSLHHETIPPHLHFRELNPHAAAEDLPLRVPTEPISWPRQERPRIAGISSFGFGGTNAHAVLQEAPPLPARQAAPRPRHVLLLSAATEGALAELTEVYAGAAEGAEAGDVCYAAAAGRAHLAQRMAVTGASSAELAAQLRAVAAGKATPLVRRGRCRPHAANKLAVLFTGQGGQQPGMGRELFDTDATFRQVMQTCDEILRPHLERPLLSVLYQSKVDEVLVHETAYTQPALFALEYALYQVWSSWGLRPEALLGHSIGEYVAACVAGALPLEEALELVAARGRLMQALPRDGSMAVVFAPVERVEPLLEGSGGQVGVAATNSGRNTVISGRTAVLNDVLGRAEAEGLNTRPVKTSHAFHSPLMEPILDEFEAVAGHLEYRPLSIPVASNVTGRLLDRGFRHDAAYWRRHVREPVRYLEGVGALREAGCTLFLELGPTPTLVHLGRDIDPAATWVAAMDKRRDDWAATTDAIAALYVAGVELDWEAFAGPHAAGKAALPLYPFERQRCWMPFPDRSRPVAREPAPAHPLLSRRK